MTSTLRRIYITGVAGMIGSNTAKTLLARGYDVVGVDSFWRGTLENITELRADSRFTFRHADLVSDEDWHRDMGPTDALIHIADIVAGIGYVFSNEWQVFQRNLLINTRVARAVLEREPARFVYLGTACSYPQQMQRSVDASVLREKDKFPADPESGYGWSKLVGEIEFRLVTKGLRTRFDVLDLHNVYGWPCVYSDGTAQVIPALINKALTAENGKLTVWGDGTQGRAFVHVDDVVDAIARLLNYRGPETNFMIGPDKCTTIAEVASLIKQHPAVRVHELVFDTSKPTGDVGRFADATLAERELGWRPEVALKDGLNRLIDRIVEHRG
jgi:GDP-D-mannose 3', 5'-epimerase